MESLDKELNELKSFIADLKADRAEQKEKDRRESWTRHTSLSIVFIAVLAAVANQKSAGFGGRVLVELNNSTFAQAKASDQWGFYQASSIKQNLHETLHDVPSQAPAVGAAEIAKREASFQEKIKKYSDNKDKAMKEAQALESERDSSRAIATESSKRGRGMGTAVSIYQISIALGSICLVVKKKWLWYLSLLVAVAATAQMIIVWIQ